MLKTYIYNGLGFPIELHDVEVVQHGDEIHPKLDIRNISEQTIKSLVFREDNLTGNQIKFIRTYVCMSTEKFAEAIHRNYFYIDKLESLGNEEIGDDGDDFMIRSLIVSFFKNRMSL